MAANETLAVLMFLSFIALVFSGFCSVATGGLAVIFSALAIVLQVDFNLPIALDWSYTSLSVNVFERYGKLGDGITHVYFDGAAADCGPVINQLMTSSARLSGRAGGDRRFWLQSEVVIGLLLASLSHRHYWRSVPFRSALACSLPRCSRATIKPKHGKAVRLRRWHIGY